jgi:hypothetical protein
LFFFTSLEISSQIIIDAPKGPLFKYYHAAYVSKNIKDAFTLVQLKRNIYHSNADSNSNSNNYELLVLEKDTVVWKSSDPVILIYSQDSCLVSFRISTRFLDTAYSFQVKKIPSDSINYLPNSLRYQFIGNDSSPYRWGPARRSVLGTIVDSIRIYDQSLNIIRKSSFGTKLFDLFNFKTRHDRFVNRHYEYITSLKINSVKLLERDRLLISNVQSRLTFEVSEISDIMSGFCKNVPFTFVSDPPGQKIYFVLSTTYDDQKDVVDFSKEDNVRNHSVKSLDGKHTVCTLTLPEKNYYVFFVHGNSIEKIFCVPKASTPQNNFIESNLK